MGGINYKSKSNIFVAILAILMLAGAIVILVVLPHPNKGEMYLGTYRGPGSLTFKGGRFYLTGEPLTITSGATHYFRVVPDHWKDRLEKLKSCGLNTVETYVPWNLHEPYPGEFNFEGILNVTKYLELAKELELHVIFRPGPFICSEWDFGGLPGWLLTDPNMKVRSTYDGYQQAVERYFSKLIPMVTKYQYSNGGPIIAFQVENEFGSYESDVTHLHFIRELFLRLGVTELLLTSDNDVGLTNDIFYNYALPTANFKELKKGLPMFDQIRSWSINFPLMVMEFWTGWFDHWTGQHDGFPVEDYSNVLRTILDAKASFNLYMFHGGTNFGFMAGANFFPGSPYKPDVTSYDYDAVLTEAGDITEKFNATRNIIIEKVLKPDEIQNLLEIPEDQPKTAYGRTTTPDYKYFGANAPQIPSPIKVQSIMALENMLNTTENVVTSDKPIAMEMLKIHGEYGQYYGYTVYRCAIPSVAGQLRWSHPPADRMQILVNGQEVGVISWKNSTQELELKEEYFQNSQETAILDLLVENHGRVNYALPSTNYLNEQRKGLTGTVYYNDTEINSWKIYPLEFKEAQVQSWLDAGDWSTTVPETSAGVVALYRGTLHIDDSPTDTFVKLEGWSKGVVLVNGFNLGRYWEAGPQQTLYLPGPLLKKGDNQIIVFEQHRGKSTVNFVDTPILDQTLPAIS